MKNEGLYVVGRSKRHHFVPQALQRYFLNRDGQVWYSEKTEDGRFSPVEKRNPRSVFWRRDYYTSLEDGRSSDFIEKEFYAKLDDFFGDFLSKAHSIFDAGRVPSISGDDLTALTVAIRHMMTRVPEFLKDHDDLALGKDVLTSTIKEALDSNQPKGEIESLQRRLMDDNEVRALGRDVRVRAQILPAPSTEAALQERVVRWAKSTGRNSYILGSRCVHRIGNGGSNGLENKKSEIWLPISPKITLVLVHRDVSKGIPLVVEDTSVHIREVNEFAVRESASVISHSEALLRSLLGQRKISDKNSSLSSRG